MEFWANINRSNVYVKFQMQRRKTAVQMCYLNKQYLKIIRFSGHTPENPRTERTSHSINSKKCTPGMSNQYA